jgi:hypothetical protein
VHIAPDPDSTVIQISLEEMMQLLGAPLTGNSPDPVRRDCLPKEPSNAPPTRLESQATVSGPNLDDRRNAQALLGRALPRLWRYALSRAEGSGQRWRRRKLRELIQWVLTKEGYRVEAQVNSPYSRDGEQVRGRVELLIANSVGGPVLALETDWSAERESLLKLAVWHQRGAEGLWILGQPCERKDLSEFRKLADRTLAHDTATWLSIYHLEHGWEDASPTRSSSFSV